MKKAIAAKPDSGSWTSLLKDMGSLVVSLSVREVRMGTTMFRRMKVK